MTPARGPRHWFRIATTNGPRRVRFCTFQQAVLVARRLCERTGLTTSIAPFVPTLTLTPGAAVGGAASTA